MSKTPAQKKKPNAIDVQVGQRVRARRMVVGMSQEKLGDALGLTFQQVQKYEKGTNRIGSSRLVQIGSALGVDASFFLDGINSANGAKIIPNGGAKLESTEIDEFLSSPTGVKVIRGFLRLDQRLRTMAARVVDALAD